MTQMKKSKQRIWALVAAGIMLMLSVFCLDVKDVHAQGAGAVSSNVHHQNYWDWYNWSVPVYSYLVDNGNGTLSRVELVSGTIVVEDYNSKMELTGSRTIPMELTDFGGFFAGEEGNYFVFGQDNPNEDDAKEVIRIVKYNKDWKRIGQSSIYGANTTIPFRAASLRMCESDNYLYIRTAREMYASSDGLNHQANMTISVQKSNMNITDYDYEVSWYNFGYCSHSFNQFIEVVDGHLVAVDHGDAYPRSIVLNYSGNDAETGVLKKDYWTNTDAEYSMLDFPGEVGANYTGAMVGGFEASNTHYLVSGSTVAHDNNYDYNEVMNVFVSVLPRDGSASAKTIYLTDYKESDNYSTSNVQMVEMDKSHYLIMWEREIRNDYGYFYPEKGVYVAMINGKGEQLGQTTFIDAQLSDCKPIVANNKVVWYVTDDSAPVFYSFSADVTNVEGFVERMYTVALNRASDPSGKAHWTNQLIMNVADGASIANDFIMSEEFIGRNLSNEKYLDVLYETFFGRPADAAGKAHWLKSLQNGSSRQYVLACFVNSDEFSEICNSYGIIRGTMEVSGGVSSGGGAQGFVSRLYDKVLNRGSDSEGIAYWTQNITTGQRTPMEVAKHFFLSDEYVSKGTSDREYVATLYQTFMGREYDEDGMNHWLNELKKGASRESVLEDFAYSPEFAEIVESFDL